MLVRVLGEAVRNVDWQCRCEVGRAEVACYLSNDERQIGLLRHEFMFTVIAWVHSTTVLSIPPTMFHSS